MQTVEFGAGILRAHRGGDAVAFAAQKTRQQVADAAVVVDQQQMRRVVGRLRRCSCDGCSLGHIYSFVFAPEGVAPKIASSTLSGSSRSIMARRNCRNSLEARRLDAAQRAIEPLGLQSCELCHQRLALGGGEKKALPAIVVAGLLHDIALVEQLLQHASERLLGDSQHVEQVGDLQSGIAVDEMQHAMMRTAEAESLELVIGVADEIAVGEKQKFDDVPAQCRGRHGRTCLVRLGAGRHRWA